MKKRYLIFVICLLVVFMLFSINCIKQDLKSSRNDNKNESFSFAFLTDIHVQPERNAEGGFKKAIEKVNELKPDFVITGGDLIMDALEVSYERADMLYKIYERLSKNFNMKVYNTIGNHEIFGWYKESGVSPSHLYYGKKLYEERLEKRYYSFDFKGWHFMILDSIAKGKERGYIGRISEEQLEWIREDLEDVEKETPVVLSTHIPFITVITQLRDGATIGTGPSEIITNSKQVLELFKNHNLKVVLQGHLHFLEEIRAKGITFITAGAVSGRWWRGPNHGMEEGFAIIKVNRSSFNWEYIDYGWEVKKEKKEKKLN